MVIIFLICVQAQGRIGITLAKKFPESRVLGVDVSEKALKVAQKNKHNLEADNIDFMLVIYLANWVMILHLIQ